MDDPFYKDIVVRSESESPKMKFGCCSTWEAYTLDDLFNKLTDFNSFVGMQWWVLKGDYLTFEEDRCKERAWSQDLRGRRKPNLSSRFKREIQNLECWVNYNVSFVS